MRMLKMCLNWKVIIGLVAVGVGIYALAPNLAVAALPVLLLAICPLSMMFMMRGMQHGQDAQGSRDEKGEQDAGENAEDLDREEQISRLRDQQQNISARIPELQTDGRRSSEDL